MGKWWKYLLDDEVGRIEKLRAVIVSLIILSLLTAVLGAILSQSWLELALIIVTLILTLALYAFERRYKIDIPVELELMIVAFIYLSIFLGNVRGFYTRFWWWDAFLHTGSGVALGLIGFLILFTLYKGNRLDAKPWVFALFTFAFAVAAGAIWEIFEYSMDGIFGYNMNKGLRDTMWDLIVDSIGAIVAAFIGYVYIKKGKTLFMSSFIQEFVKKNPTLFRKRYGAKNKN